MISQKKLDKWVSSGIITPEQKSRIIEEETANKNGMIGRLINFLAIFTIGLGIISIIAANWDVIGDIAKLGTMFLLMIGCNCLIYKWKNEGKIEKAEKMLVGAFLLVGAMIGLIIQIYQLSGEKSYNVLGVWCLISVPYLLIAEKNYMAKFFMLLVMLWFNIAFFDWLKDTLLTNRWYVNPYIFLITTGAFAGLVFIAKMLMLYGSKISFAGTMRNNALWWAYFNMIVYICLSWDSLAYLFIALVVLSLTALIFNYYKSYYLVARNVKLAGLVVLVFYINIASRIGLLSSGFGLILSGVVLLMLLKLWGKYKGVILGRFNNEK